MDDVANNDGDSRERNGCGASQDCSATERPPPRDNAEVRRRIVTHGYAALEMLFEAVFYAQDLNRTLWDFSLEINLLRQTGLSDSHLRWLLCKGYLEHAKELRNAGDGERRCFKPTASLSFRKSSCFVLTESGQDFVREALRQFKGRSVERPSSPVPARQSPEQPVSTPTWDRDRQELRVGRQIVKQFKVPAPNQEVILATFEEEAWPSRIDDPLPPHPDLDPKRRLQDTIIALNRNQKTEALRFLGDGTGEGVCWHFIHGSDSLNAAMRKPK